jgi:iron(III) transport system substrate-binding protein
MRRQRCRLSVLWSLGLAGALVVAACGSGTVSSSAVRPTDPAVAALVDAAKSEGSVNIYTNLQKPLNDAVASGYRKLYGDAATFQQLSTPSIDPRYQADVAAGAVQADLVITSDCPFIGAEVKNGTMVALTSAGIPGYPGAYPAAFRSDDIGTASVQINPWGIGYNTNLLSAADAPTSWLSLLDAKWKGKIGIISPDSSSPVTLFYYYLLQTYGADYLKKLVAQKAGSEQASANSAASALGAGEFAVTIPTADQVMQAISAAGGPAAYTQPQQTTGIDICVGLSTKAPHPKAARLFLSYLLSPAGSNLLNKLPGAVGPFGGGSALPGQYTKNVRTVTQAIKQQVDAAMAQ